MAKGKSNAERAAEKDALVKEAQALGIDVSGKTAKQLASAIAKSKGASAPDPEEKALGGKAPAKNATEVNVIDSNGVIRTYSVEEHGKKFLEHAEEFASKVEGRKVVAVE